MTRTAADQIACDVRVTALRGDLERGMAAEPAFLAGGALDFQKPARAVMK